MLSSGQISISSNDDSFLLLQFTDAMKAGIEKISGPVTVTLSDIHAGSVVFTTTVGFLNGNTDAVAAYKTALKENPSSIYGSSYQVTVDTASIKDAEVSNPGESSWVWQLMLDMCIVRHYTFRAC